MNVGTFSFMFVYALVPIPLLFLGFKVSDWLAFWLPFVMGGIWAAFSKSDGGALAKASGTGGVAGLFYIVNFYFGATGKGNDSVGLILIYGAPALMIVGAIIGLIGMGAGMLASQVTFGRRLGNLEGE